MQTVSHVLKCTGCRTCEIACSYHHKKTFFPRTSSIEVRRGKIEGEFRLVVYREDEDERIACDKCGFCLQYCPVTAREELKTFLELSMV